VDQRQLIESRPPGSPGWKIGLNVPAVQEHFGLEGPVIGWLAEPGPVAAPLAELEIAAYIGEDGGIEALGPAIEYAQIDPAADSLEKILDLNVFHRGVVFGERFEDARNAAAEEMVDHARGVLGDALKPGDVVICGAMEILQLP
jgi:2-keto-4-pentenoate hydratase